MPEVPRASERLAVRELVPDDVHGVLAIYGDLKATEHLSFDPRTHDQVEAMVTRSIAAAAAEPRTEYVLAIVEQGQGQLVGIGRLAAAPHQPRAATTGFALRSNRWGKGYGVEMVRLLLGFAFGDLGLHRVWGARSPLNTASAKTMAAVGMVEEGTIREHVQRGGVWRDSVVHAILDREWRERAT
ncbi:GNAT family protein [Streptomyces spectabilis]|uniref:GNAT family N-acetyltransferase n=1 Tax=Streptomyces spectabilis TaxID=68270 RepID=UPI003406BB65